MKTLSAIMLGLLLSICTPLYASPTIDFSHFVNGTEGVLLEVTNMDESDSLNVRDAPNARANIRYKIPFGSADVMSYDPDIASHVGKSHWIGIRLSVEDGFVMGYVNARYLKFAALYDTAVTRVLDVRFPYFLEQGDPADDWLRIYKNVSANYYSGCDMRDEPTIRQELPLFDIQFKVYETLKAALLDTIEYKPENALRYYDEASNWFHNTGNSAFQAIDEFDWQGYRYTVGAEGCGIHLDYYQRGGKILVMKHPFDTNPRRSADGEPLPKTWTPEDIRLLTSTILEDVQL
ncbi:SH3 domain-containing protein [Leucothrix mucor]|uniref:SH3 domain-containing protein n=1 Tax=Leucothrix mucor TaxID=45248 RepID=UPI0003B7AE8B|nr:SH3 domain-containing protein [Leucothrix mucor]